MLSTITSRIFGALAIGAMFIHPIRAEEVAKPPASRPQKSAAASRDAAKAIAPAGTFLIEKTPSWVVPVADGTAPVPAAAMSYSIIDEQEKVDGPQTQHYTHLVRVIKDASGLGSAAQLEIDFDPTYQTLALHHIDVIRAGKRTTRLDRSAIKLLQRETQLEQRIYDGRVTASAILTDVRVDDRIEIDYTLRGANPVFEGRYFDLIWAARDRGPISKYVFRLLIAPERPLQYHAGPQFTVTDNTRSGTRELTFTATSVAQLRGEEGAPASAYLDQTITLTEYQDWASVAAWGTHLFETGGDAAPEVVAKANEIRSVFPDQAQQLIAALNYVQKEVRYFGTEIGASSHRPAPPAKTMSQRYGDCKDKAVLLVALLKQLGIAAHPVLVSTGLHHAVSDFLPMPLPFDHVIAQVVIGENTYYLDGTRLAQTGTPLARQSVGLGKGLILANGVTGLNELPGTSNVVREDAEDIIKITDYAESPVLESRVTYYSDLAEAVRTMLQTRQADEVAQALSTPYSQWYPNLKIKEPYHVEENPQENAVVIIQKFELPEFWKFNETGSILVSNVSSGILLDLLRYPNTTKRTLPLEISLPGIYRQSIRLEYPDDVWTREDSASIEESDSHFHLRGGLRMTARSASFTSELSFDDPIVPAADWPAYTEKILASRKRLVRVNPIPLLTPQQQATFVVQVKKLQEEAVQGRAKYKTATEVRATLSDVVLTMALNGDRLAGQNRGEALLARGIHRDHSGKFDLAAMDYTEALKLTSKPAPVYAAMAVNDSLRGDLKSGIEMASKAIALDPTDTGALFTLAYSRYLAEDYVGAKQSLLEGQKSSSRVSDGYGTIWLYITSKRLGGNGIDTIQPYLAAVPNDRWPGPILGFLSGKINEDKLIAAAKDGKADAEHLTEAYFFLGELAYASGDLARAKDYFKRTTDLGVVEFIENGAAKLQLQKLSRN